MQRIMHYGFLFLSLILAAVQPRFTVTVETNFKTVRRNFEWAIESSPQLNLTQYLMEKGHLESPVFDLQDSAKSRGVLRMVHLPGTHQVVRYFSVSQGGPLKMIHHRLSLVNQLLKSKDLQTNGYSLTLAMGDSLGHSHWTFENLTNTTRGFVKDGVVIFKVELDFLDRTVESVEQKTGQQIMTTSIASGEEADSRGKEVLTDISTSYMRIFDWKIKMTSNLEMTQYLEEIAKRPELQSLTFDFGDSNNTKLVMYFHRAYNYDTHMDIAFQAISGGLRNVTYRLSLVNQLLIAEDYTTSGSINAIGTDNSYGFLTFSLDQLRNPRLGYISHGEVLFRLEISFFDGIKNSRKHQ